MKHSASLPFISISLASSLFFQASGAAKEQRDTAGPRFALHCGAPSRTLASGTALRKQELLGSCSQHNARNLTRKIVHRYARLNLPELRWHGAYYMAQHYGLTGAGIHVGIWEGGHILQSHREFDNLVGGKRRVVLHEIDQGHSKQDRSIPPKPIAISDHATHVAGTIGAQGRNFKALGAATQVTLHSYHRHFDTDEMGGAATTTATTTGISVSNHSYSQIVRTWINRKEANDEKPVGSPAATCPSDWYWSTQTKTSPGFGSHYFGKYTARTAKYDAVVYEHPSLSVFASSSNNRDWKKTPREYCRYNENTHHWEKSTQPLNEDSAKRGGYDTLPPWVGLAKNVITIGSLENPPHHRNEIKKRSDVVSTESSGAGPTDDGRIKPDVVAIGSIVQSASVPPRCAGREPTCQPDDINRPHDNDRYKEMSGTSMATPIATGIGVLLNELALRRRQFRRESFAISEPKPRQLFADEMKTVLVHTALSAREDFGPSYLTGWGAIQADKAAKLVLGEEGRLYRLKIKRDGDIKLEAEWTHKVPARITISWIDKPAQGTTSEIVDDFVPTLVNDINIDVKGSKGPFHPWSLDRKKPSFPPTNHGPNTADNVKRIDVPLKQRANGTEKWTIHITTNPNCFVDQEVEFALAVYGLDHLNLKK
jgi:subtilisin family serine protease